MKEMEENKCKNTLNGCDMVQTLSHVLFIKATNVKCRV